MSVVTMIKEIKEVHPEEIVLVKIGNFFHVYGKDSYILSYLLGYKIRENCYEILEILYEANLMQNVDKKKELLYKSIAKVKAIDYLLNLSYDKQIISNKKYIKLGAKLDDIIKYISGWLKSLNDNKVE